MKFHGRWSLLLALASIACSSNTESPDSSSSSGETAGAGAGSGSSSGSGAGAAAGGAGAAAGGAGAGGSSAGAGGSSGAGGEGGIPFVPATKFDARAASWSTPEGGYADYGFNQVVGGNYEAGNNHWTLQDMDGDGKPDLVVSAKAGVQFGDPGARFWRVFKNTGSGFASTATSWTTPDGGYADYGFNQVMGGNYEAGNNHWTLQDMDGDGKPELVVSAKAGVQFGDPGARFWRVFKNTGSGFASTATSWTTPDGGYADYGFNQVMGGNYEAGNNHWTLQDMDGDGKPELVVSAKAGVQFGTPGARTWRVFKNTGSGFAASATQWATPDGGYADYGFNQVGGGNYEAGNNHWTLQDMDGDGKPDLVVSAKAGVQFGTPGARTWRVFKNTASGFAASATQWATPDGGYADYGFNQVGGGNYEAGNNHWTLQDMDGDGKPDLVVSAKAGVQFGTPGARTWRVFKNTASGFAASATQWATPDGGYANYGFNQVGGGNYEAGNNHFTTTDLDGDGKPDLVVSAEAGVQFASSGGPFWNVYLATP